MRTTTTTIRTTPHVRHRRRRGVTAVIAMIFLVLFSTMALGFYGTTTMSVQVAGNETRGARAMQAADSGMHFVRYQLWDLTIPPLTLEQDLMDEVYGQLADRLDGTANMKGQVVEMPDADTIVLPGGGKYITTDEDGGAFRATFHRVGKKVRVKVVGVYQPNGSGGAVLATSSRAIQLDYDVAEKASSLFDYGLAARGKVETSGSSWVKGATDSSKGSVMSAAVDPLNPTVILAGKGISGSVTYMEGSAKPSISGEVGGTTNTTTIWEKYVKTVDEQPMFPVVDTALFEKYVTNTYVPGTSVSPYVNMRIPANTNPEFVNDEVIQGILFVEMPNIVKFTGKVNIQGVIVVDPNDTTDLTKNQILFSGTGGTKQGVETLPLGDSRFDGLRDLTGSFILAPETFVSITGNFGLVNGSIIADKVEMNGSAYVDVKGSIITLDPDAALKIGGNGNIVIQSTGTSNYPAGLRFGEHYYPVPGSYKEVRP
jgi:hypothetical protein